MYADHKYTELCGPRHLLVLLCAMGWKGGHIFCSTEELHDPPADGIYKTKIDYDSFLKHVQHLCRTVLIKRDNTKIGLHSWRKTGYTLAIFRGGYRDDIKLSARHSLKSTDAPIYSKEAMSSLESHKRNPNQLNSVRKWSCVLIASGDQAGVMTEASGSMYCEMSDLPDFFVHRLLKVEKNHPSKNDIRFLLDRAYHYVKTEGPERN